MHILSFAFSAQFFKRSFLCLFVYLSICRYVWFADGYLPKPASFVFPRPSAPAYWPAPVRSHFASLVLAIWPRPLTCMGLTSGPSALEWNSGEDVAHTTLHVLSGLKPDCRSWLVRSYVFKNNSAKPYTFYRCTVCGFAFLLCVCQLLAPVEKLIALHSLKLFILHFH